jgi:hypothetical protein
MFIGTRLLILALGSFVPWASAQTNHYNWNVHGEGNLGSCVHGYRYSGASAGAEGFIWKRLSGGGRVFAGKFSDSDPFALVHGELGYHAVNRREPGQTDPFVTFGMGVAGGRGRTSMSAGFGGGANFWIKPSMALRFEGRIVAFHGDAVIIAQIGMAFR